MFRNKNGRPERVITSERSFVNLVFHKFPSAMKQKSREGSGLRDGFVFKYCLSCISATVAESG